MGKLEEMMRELGANVGESMGEGRGRDAAGSGTPPVHGVPHAPAYAGVPARLQGVSKSKAAAEIPVDKIQPDPDQPREEFDEDALQRLAESLKSRGQLQPIRVRWDEGRGAYVIVCGERRWRAAVKAGLPMMSCVVMEGPVAAVDLLALQLIENCVREDLRPIEQARAFKALIDQNGWSVRRVADEVSVSHVSVVRALSLLELPEAVQSQVEQGALPPATAYEITKVADPAEREQLAARAVEEKLTRADVVAAREKRETRPKPRRVELKVPNGCTVTISLTDPVSDDEEAIVALQHAIRILKKQRASRPDAA
jgi:ParB family transcriptional regulator, chromosome partitioning protein